MNPAIVKLDSAAPAAVEMAGPAVPPDRQVAVRGGRISQPIAIGLVFPSSRGRLPESADVTRLMDSMREVGLINPISVRKTVRHRGTTPFDAYEVVAGNHRYKAACNLGWQEIECIVVDMDEPHVELAEIDENLIRRNLTPAQEAIALERRKEIFEELHPETKAGVAGGVASGIARGTTPKFGVVQKGFAADTAENTGKSPAKVFQSIARAGLIGKQDMQAIVGTSLDKGVELDALAKLPVEQRKPIIERAAAGEKVSARPARPEAPPTIETTYTVVNDAVPSPPVAATAVAYLPATPEQLKASDDAATLLVIPLEPRDRDDLLEMLDRCDGESLRLALINHLTVEIVPPAHIIAETRH